MGQRFPRKIAIVCGSDMEASHLDGRPIKSRTALKWSLRSVMIGLSTTIFNLGPQSLMESLHSTLGAFDEAGLTGRDHQRASVTVPDAIHDFSVKCQQATARELDASTISKRKVRRTS